MRAILIRIFLTLLIFNLLKKEIKKTPILWLCQRTRVSITILRVPTSIYHYLTIMTSLGTIIPWHCNGCSRDSLLKFGTRLRDVFIMCHTCASHQPATLCLNQHNYYFSSMSLSYFDVVLSLLQILIIVK